MESKIEDHTDAITPEWCKYEKRELTHIGLPVGLTFLATTGMSFTSMAVLGHLGTKYLASAAAATVWMEVTSYVLAGFGSGLTTLAAQALGANNNKLVGLYVQMSIFWSLVINVPIIGLWMATEPVMKLINLNSEEAVLAGEYAMWSALRLIPFTLFMMMQAYLQVLRQATPTMIVSFVGLVLNFGFNMLFVHGLGKWKGLGFIGAPISTALTRVIMVIVLYWYAFHWKKLHKQTWGDGWDLREALGKGRSRRYLLTQVLPLCIGMCLEEWQLQVIVIFATQLGSVQVATHNAILACFFVLTSFMYGVMAAVRVRLANYLGSNEPNRAKRVSLYGLTVASIFAVLIAIFFFTSRGFLGRVFSNDPEVWKLTKDVQIITGFSYLCISFFYVSMATLDGQGRPIPVAVAFLIGAWIIGVPASYIFAFVLKQDLKGLWYGLITGYVTVSFIVGFIVLKSDWVALAARARERAEKSQAPLDGEEGVPIENQTNQEEPQLGVEPEQVESSEFLERDSLLKSNKVFIKSEYGSSDPVSSSASITVEVDSGYDISNTSALDSSISSNDCHLSDSDTDCDPTAVEFESSGHDASPEEENNAVKFNSKEPMLGKNNTGSSDQ